MDKFENMPCGNTREKQDQIKVKGQELSAAEMRSLGGMTEREAADGKKKFSDLSREIELDKYRSFW